MGQGVIMFTRIPERKEKKEAYTIFDKIMAKILQTGWDTNPQI